MPGAIELTSTPYGASATATARLDVGQGAAASRVACANDLVTRRVGRVVGQRHARAGRGNVDDAAGALVPHDLPRGLAGKGKGGDVERHRPRPGLECRLEKGLDDAVGGVVDEYVDPAPAFDNPRDRLLRRPLDGEVANDLFNLAPFRPTEPRRLGRALDVHIGNADVTAPAGQLDGDFPPQPTARPRHQYPAPNLGALIDQFHSPIELPHVIPVS